jgi:multisubunit Na+/H+ antiporter MnhB subunit
MSAADAAGASAPLPERRPLRSAGAVAAGFALVFVLSVATDALCHATGLFPPFGQRMGDGLFLLATAYRSLYTVAGGWLTARLAPARPMRHALVLAAIGTAAALAGAAATWNRGPEFGPHWYPVALVVLALPCIWAGARLRARAAPRPPA